MTNVTGTNQVDAYTPYASKKKETKETKTEKKADDGKVKKTSDYGKTIGEPKLSEKAQKYYEKLKKKFGQYDFILVSEDQKANAQANAGKYANPYKTVVLIDEDKIERMASDESYRKKYEGILSGATAQLQQLKASMEKSGANVQGYGMQMNDGGTASFFAVLKKSNADLKVRQEKAAAKKKAEKKAAEKKAEKKEAEERLHKSSSEKSGKTEKDSKADKDSWDDYEDDTVTITADSIEELMRKIEEFNFNERGNQVQTESEKAVGQNFDFRG